ncbi:PDDEXK nuclease domain-containing protein [Paludibaculum fermentans]|uniref:PDDEXK nuclease domain-containing protein n=1 Tax=Paludibaculum fermentans TaxID=1473598 RepID=UPI003EBB6362
MPPNQPSALLRAYPQSHPGRHQNYAREHWVLPGGNPPVGLVLCSERNDAVAHCALGNLNNQVLAREYKLNLPEEGVLVREIADTRRALQLRAQFKPTVEP